MNDFEKYLENFASIKPSEEFRRKVIATSKQAWHQPAETAKIIRSDWGWRWIGRCAAAAALLILLNGVAASLHDRWVSGMLTSRSPESAGGETVYEQLCVELGRDPVFARQFRQLVALNVPAPDLQNVVNQRNALFQSKELINGG